MKSVRLFGTLGLTGILLLAACSQPAQTPTQGAPVASATALSNPGTVMAWGMTPPPGLNNVVAISGGADHSLALRQDGTAVGWGDNAKGQITIPAQATNLTAIAAGGYFSLGLKSDGTVVGWGLNTQGQINIPVGLNNVRSIAAGFDHSLALRQDGTVVGWGTNNTQQINIPPGLTGVSAISAGNLHSMALKSDGTVVAWGFNFYGQTNVPPGLTGVTAISAGSFHSVALKSDGTVVAWGNNETGQTNVPVGLSNVVAIAAGGIYTLALKSDGSLVGWGSNTGGQLSFPPLNSVSAIAGGFRHTMALIPDTTAPTANPSIASGTVGNNGWYKSDVGINWNWTDGGSSITAANCTANTNSSGEGTLTLNATCQDPAGNTGSASITLKVDKTAPALNPVVSPNPVLLGAAASVSSNASDTTSGLASQSCDTPLANSVGANTVNCTATDNAGHSTSKTASYSVIYNFSFASPIAPLPSLNQVKGGALIPIVFSLGGNQGTAILATASPTSQAIACDNAPLNVVSQTLKNGAGSLRYNSSTNTYTYVWKTDRAWNNTCRQLSLTLADGQTYKANFKIVK